MLSFDFLPTARLLDVEQVLVYARNSGAISVDAVLAGIAEYRRAKRQAGGRAHRKGAAPPALVRCDKCGAPAKVSGVNICASTRVAGGWRSVIECTSADCMAQQYSKQSVSDLLRELRRRN